MEDINELLGILRSNGVSVFSDGKIHVEFHPPTGDFVVPAQSVEPGVPVTKQEPKYCKCGHRTISHSLTDGSCHMGCESKQCR